MSNTISVVIPLFNKASYIARAIDSVLAQTQPVDELIVVDDASTDGSLERLQVYHDPRIRILRRTDPRQRGLPATRNLGIVSAKSHWIALLDADDRWHDNFIDEMQKLMDHATDCDGVLFAGWENVWTNGRVTRDAYSRRHQSQIFKRLDLEGFVSAWCEVGTCPVSASGVVIRRDVLLAAGLFNERCRKGADKEMWIRLLAISDALSSAHVCSSYYRAIPGAMNDTISTNRRHCLCDTLDDIIARSSGSRQHLLKRLFNQTIIEYARATAGRERLLPEVYRGFFVSLDPLAYLGLLLLKHMPVPLLRIARRGVSMARNLSGPIR